MTVVITGAAGALGRAAVAEFRARGDTVVALVRPGDEFDGLAEHGSDAEVHPVSADLSDQSAVAAAWERIDEFASPSVLIALAGGYAGGTLTTVDTGTLDAMLQTNLATTLWSCQAAASRLRSAGGGAIVTVGSRTAVRGSGPVAHATSKAAVLRLTELLAGELRPSGIRVNAVLPSVIDTPANRSWMSADLASRAVPPSAIARVIAFLASEDAWPVSGAAVPVYGDA